MRSYAMHSLPLDSLAQYFVSKIDLWSCMYHCSIILHEYISFVHFTVDVHLGCFQLHVIINRVAVNIVVFY